MLKSVNYFYVRGMSVFSIVVRKTRSCSIGTALCFVERLIVS